MAGLVGPDWPDRGATHSERTLAVTSDATPETTSRQVIGHLAVLVKEREPILTWRAAGRYPDRSVPVTVFTLAFPVALMVFTLIVVVTVSGAAVGDHVVDGDEVGMVTAHLDDPIRRDSVVVREEPDLNEIHHVVISQDDGVPLLARLLFVVSPRLTVWRSWCDDDWYVVDLGADAVAHRDVPPGHPSQSHVDDRCGSHSCALRDEEHDRQLVVADSALAEHDHFTLRHLVIIRHCDMEVSNLRVDADGCLSINVNGNEQRAHDEQYAGRFAHLSLSAD